MAEKTIKWIDLIYKISVIVGGILIVWLNATFATKADVKNLERKIDELSQSIAITNNNAEHFKQELGFMHAVDRDIETRVRNLEAKR